MEKTELILQSIKYIQIYYSNKCYPIRLNNFGNIHYRLDFSWSIHRDYLDHIYCVLSKGNLRIRGI